MRKLEGKPAGRGCHRIPVRLFEVLQLRIPFKERHMNRAKLIRYGMPPAIAVLLAFIYSIEYHTVYLIRNESYSYWIHFRNSLLAWLPVILMYPAVVWLARRFRITAGNWYRNVPVHCLCALTFSVLRSSITFAIFKYSGLYPGLTFRSYLFMVVEFIVYLFLLYWAIVGAHHFLEHARARREYELTASRLKAQLAWARLDALKAQLHPHFLFNTLNTISSIVHEDPNAADRMISRLGDLLRMILSRSETQEISLKEELEFIDNYLEIQKIRWQDRLQITTDVPVEVMNALVPVLILQPIVENALRHGISPRRDGGHLAIRASQKAGMAMIEVEDSGPGISGDYLERGTGLRNTKERLKQRYGQNHTFTIGKGRLGGALITIGVPYSVDQVTSGKWVNGKI